MTSRLRRIVPLDNFVLVIFATVALAFALPASGTGAVVLDWVAKAAIALLFFLYGARLSPAQAWAGLKNWKLHLAVLAFTFALFPVIGLAAQLLPHAVLPEELKPGFLYLTTTPSTVQSSIAFVAIAGGDVAAAVVAASLSSLLGVLLTPALVILLMGSASSAGGLGAGASSAGGLDWSSAVDVATQILLPFLVGQAARRWVGDWVKAHAARLKLVDQGSILIMVYNAFSLGVSQGVWRSVSLPGLFALVLDCAALLAVVLGLTAVAGKLLRLSYAERAVLLFCGSKKSLAAGLPMAQVLFGPAKLGLVVLPLMVFHQIQLIVCAMLAQRMGEGERRRAAQ